MVAFNVVIAVCVGLVLLVGAAITFHQRAAERQTEELADIVA